VDSFHLRQNLVHNEQSYRLTNFGDITGELEAKYWQPKISQLVETILKIKF
jgi:hypothetical protein